MTRPRRESVPAAALALVLPLMCCAGEPSPQRETAPAASREAAGREISWTGAVSEEQFKAMHELKEGGVPDLRGTMVELAGGHAYLSLPEGKPPFPGVVVIQEWWGLNDHIKLWTDRMAAEGYAALAVDLYDGKVATNSDEAMAYVGSVEEARALEILQAACAFLKSDARVQAAKLGSIGWCFGGGWSLRLAIAEPDLDACVMYYGRVVDSPEELGRIQAKLCGVFANRDQSIPPDAVNSFEQALQAAKVDYQIHRYDAEHAFANPSNPRYDAKSADAAWGVVRHFLEYHLKK
jgi:carboxymethylenebutenolidase